MSSTALAALIAAALVIGGGAGAVMMRKRSNGESPAKGDELISAESSLQQAPPPTKNDPPRLVRANGIAWMANDEYVRAFLDDLGITCPNGDAISVRTYLEMQTEQAKAYGLYQDFTVEADTSKPKPVVLVTKTLHGRTGHALVGYPERVVFSYVVDWPSTSFYQAVPRTPDTDPITSMNTHLIPACNNNYLRLHHTGVQAHASAQSDEHPTALRPDRSTPGGVEDRSPSVSNQPAD
jgi:hypothetical protein